MSLSPYLNPTNLNGALRSTNRFSEVVYPRGAAGDNDAFDKQNPNNTSSLRQLSLDIIDSAKEISDSISNAAGTRSPMYVIGEITQNPEARSSGYLPSEINGLMRAVSKALDGVKQTGVIVDGLGKAEGTLSVEYTKNPAYFIGSNIIDQRYRVPAKLRMTVMVSNYLSDDVAGTLADTISALDPTGLWDNTKNMLLYGGNTRSQYALYRLRWLMENAIPFTVHTPHGIYENMLIRTLNPITDASKMDMLYCDIEFQEIIFCKPYSNTPGLVPGRKGVQRPREGWGEKAAQKLIQWGL